MFWNLSWSSTALATVTPSLDLRTAPGRFNNNIPALGAHGHTDGVSQHVHSCHHFLSDRATKPDVLGVASVGESSQVGGGPELGDDSARYSGQGHHLLCSVESGAGNGNVSCRSESSSK